jgi:hypothetical protein
MRPAETIATLASFEKRGAGTDEERRAASRLAEAIGDPARREAHPETFWCRPDWALAHAWHVALGLAGSLIAESSPRVGGALLIVALLSVIADETTGISLGRRLTPERASQNVVSESGTQAVHLIVTAGYDARRAGLVYRDGPRKALRAVSVRIGRWTPGWLGWLAIALLWLIVIAVLRLEGHRGTLIGVAQLIPTVGLVLALALLLELASARYRIDDASGAAAAIALSQALDAAPPRHLSVDLVLQGADGIGLRRFLRARDSKAPTTIVLGIAPCGDGSPGWFESDGPLIPLAYFKELRRLCAGLGAQPLRSRSQTPALPARLRRLPAIALGTSRGAGDNPVAIDRTVELGLLLVDGIDAYVGRRLTADRAPTPA